jgi:hypothetical protein
MEKAKHVSQRLKPQTPIQMQGLCRRGRMAAQRIMALYLVAQRLAAEAKSVVAAVVGEVLVVAATEARNKLPVIFSHLSI